MKNLLLAMALIASIHAETWKCSSLTEEDSKGAGVYSYPSPTMATFTLTKDILSLKIGSLTPRVYRRSTDYLSGTTIFTGEAGLVAVFLDNPQLFMVIDGEVSYLIGDCGP